MADAAWSPDDSSFHPLFPACREIRCRLRFRSTGFRAALPMRVRVRGQQSSSLRGLWASISQHWLRYPLPSGAVLGNAQHFCMEAGTGLRRYRLLWLAGATRPGDSAGRATGRAGPSYRRGSIAPGLRTHGRRGARAGPSGHVFSGRPDSRVESCARAQPHAAGLDPRAQRRPGRERLSRAALRSIENLRVQNLSRRDLPAMAGALCLRVACTARYRSHAARRHQGLRRTRLPLLRRQRS